jgi:CSLREA domain-containing protein
MAATVALFGAVGPVTTAVAAAGAGRTLAVNSRADAHDADPGDGHCRDAAGRCTLRAAIEEADALAPVGGVRIPIPPGDYQLSLGTLLLGAPSRGRRLSVEIAGSPGRPPVIDAGRRFRVLSVAPATEATLENLTLTNGDAGTTSSSDFGYGGGIYSEGVVSLLDVEVTNNRGSAGGGVDNAGGSLVVTASRITGNDGGEFGGGGIQNGGPGDLPGSVTVASSVISDNTTGNEGGGIFSGQNGRPVAGRPSVAPAERCAELACRRVPSFASSLTVSVRDSVISANTAGNGGGGIAAQGPTTVVRSRILDNSAGSAVGGGLFDVAYVQDSTLDGNSAASGGALEVFPSLHATITSSTLDDNHASVYGGAIDVDGSVAVTRSTLAHNTAGGQFVGGGAAAILDGGGQLQLTNSTVADNITIPPGGGAIYNYAGIADLRYDTLADNSSSLTGGGFTAATATVFAGTSAEPACRTAVHETSGFDLDTDDSCELSLSTDQPGTDPRLAALADNGGPTLTELPLADSPLIDRGGTPTTGCPRVDQRGQPRPSGPACDIGSVETQRRITTAQRRRLSVS